MLYSRNCQIHYFKRIRVKFIGFAISMLQCNSFKINGQCSTNSKANV